MGKGLDSDMTAILVIERDGHSHVIGIETADIATTAQVTVYPLCESEPVRTVDLYYAGLGVYYEKGEPCEGSAR